MLSLPTSPFQTSAFCFKEQCLLYICIPGVTLAPPFQPITKFCGFYLLGFSQIYPQFPSPSDNPIPKHHLFSLRLQQTHPNQPTHIYPHTCFINGIQGNLFNKTNLNVFCSLKHTKGQYGQQCGLAAASPSFPATSATSSPFSVIRWSPQPRDLCTYCFLCMDFLFFSS